MKKVRTFPRQIPSYPCHQVSELVLLFPRSVGFFGLVQGFPWIISGFLDMVTGLQSWVFWSLVLVPGSRGLVSALWALEFGPVWVVGAKA